jgi:hypothetical protein
MPRVPALVLACLAASCAREAEPETAYAYAASTAPVFAPIWVVPTAAPQTTPPPPPRLSGHDIPSGDACLERLDSLGVHYRRLDAKKGIETPIVTTGPVGGIRYFANGGLPLVCDCRLALALHQIGPLLASHGVSAIRFSGAYSYRLSRVGRLSLHAYGLAIDLHEFVVGGQNLSVERDFVRGLGDGCAADAPALDQIACTLRQTGLFKELLTPDYNADHHDHIHVAIAPLVTASSRD